MGIKVKIHFKDGSSVQKESDIYGKVRLLEHEENGKELIGITYSKSGNYRSFGPIYKSATSRLTIGVHKVGPEFTGL